MKKKKKAELVEQPAPTFPQSPDLTPRPSKKQKVTGTSVIAPQQSPHYEEIKGLEDIDKVKGPGELTLAKGKGPAMEFGDSHSHHATPLTKLDYKPEVSMLREHLGPLALVLMQHFLFDADLLDVREETEQELNEQIALGLFRVSYLLAIIYLSVTFSPFLFILGLCADSFSDGRVD